LLLKFRTDWSPIWHFSIIGLDHHYKRKSGLRATSPTTSSLGRLKPNTD
jgi:hypothetical protein